MLALAEDCIRSLKASFRRGNGCAVEKQTDDGDWTGITKLHQVFAKSKDDLGNKLRTEKVSKRNE